MHDRFDVLIVGAGHAGAQAAIALRQHKFEGTIGMVGDEPELPYERPPLSKEYLAGEKSFERILIRPPAFWEDRGIDVQTATRVCNVDPRTKTVKLQDGTIVGYGSLIWATGGRARTLAYAGAELRGVHVIRTRADVDAMIAELPQVQSVVIIGGGYIGLEAAAALRKFGKKVTLLEAQSRVLARVAGEPISRFYEQEHGAQGVEIHLNADFASFEGSDGWLTGARLQGGGVIPAQLAVVGVGIIPAVEPLIQAGATGSNGIDVDQCCRTSIPDVYAIGDCAAHESAFAGNSRVRVESVQNANDQATTAAKAIVGSPEPYRAIPWFWSNQFDLRLQSVGLSSGFDDMVIRGNPANRSFSVVYLKKGKVIALDCVNSVKDYVQGKALITSGITPDRTKISDAELPLKELL